MTRWNHTSQPGVSQEEDPDFFEYPASPLPKGVRAPGTRFGFGSRKSLLWSLLLGLIPALGLVFVSARFLDQPVMLFSKNLGLGKSQILEWISFVASGQFVFPSLVLSGLLNWFVTGDKVIARRFLFVFLSVALSPLACFAFLKAVPWAMSISSGQTSLIAAFALALYLVYPRLRWIYLITALVVCVNRVLLDGDLIGGYLSDVLLGAYLGLLVTALVKKAFEHFTGRL